MRLTLLLLLCSLSSLAQQKTITGVTNSCSQESLKKNLYYLADAKLGGRLMGSHGDTLASQYVAECFKANGLTAPCKNGKSYFQAITAYKLVDTKSFSINNTPYEEFDGWSLYPGSPINLKNIPVLLADYDSLKNFYHDIPAIDLKGKAVFLNGNAVEEFYSGNIDSLETILKNKGVVLFLWKGNLDKMLASQKARKFLPRYQEVIKEFMQISVLPEIGLSQSRVNDLLADDHISATTDGHFNTGKTHYFQLKATVSVQLEQQRIEEHAPNVIGVVKGTDTTLACIVVSAHHDHDGIDGKDIYYGSVDNASGTVAIMEMAAMLKRAAAQGLRPKRTIVFASYTGEERGLLGSAWYADHPVYTMAKTYGVLNIDMFGRVDTLHSGKKPDSTNYVYILVKDDLNHGLRHALFDANDASVKLTLDTYYENPKYTARRLKGSDQYPLFLQGVPFVRIDCGFCKDYHKPTDTPDKINYELLTKQTKLAFNTLWNMANR